MRFLKIFLLIFGFLSLVWANPLFAEGERKLSHQEALEIALETLKIPERYILSGSNDLFDYYPTWTFYLEDKDNREDRIEIRVDAENGMLRFYANYNPEEATKAMTEDEAKTLALSFLEAHLSPEEFQQLYLILNIRWSFYEENPSYEFNFRRSVNGYPFLQDGIIVTIYNGKVHRYDVKWTKVTPKPEGDKVMEPAQARALFHSHFGLELGYIPDTPYFDYGFTDKELTLAYYPKAEGVYLDTKNQTFFRNYGHLVPKIPLYTVEPMSRENKGITKALDLDQEGAKKIARDFISLPGNFNLQGSFRTENNFWTFAWGLDEDQMERTVVTVDGNTGEITKYYTPESLIGSSKDMKVDWLKAQEIAREYIKKVLPGRLHLLGEVRVLDPNFKAEAVKGLHTVHFPILANGLPIQGRGVTVKINGDGVIVSYEAKLWYGKFPKVEVPIEKREAQAIFDRRYIKPLAYINHDYDKNPVLAYAIGENPGGQRAYIHGTTGLIMGLGSNDQESRFLSSSLDHWAGPQLRRLTSMGVIDPTYEDFKHKAMATRGQFVKLLARALRINPIYPRTDTFTDVSRDMYDYGYIEAVASKGFVLGDKGKFNPHAYVTREEIAVILARTLGNQGGQGKAIIFKDANKISPWAEEGIERASNLGLIKGDNKGNLKLSSLREGIHLT